MQSTAARLPAPLLRFLLLAAVAFLAHGPALGGEFLWDDDDWILGCELLREPGGLWRIWTEPSALIQYYPLSYTSWWLDVRLWAFEPLPWHVENLLLHVLVATLFGELLRRLAVPGATLAALLFVLHPVHVESVAWLTERKNVLSGVLYVASILSWVRWLDTGWRRAWGASLFLFFLALSAKTATLVLPVVLLLLAWWRGGRLERRSLLAVLPFLALSALAALVTIELERSTGTGGHDWDLGLLERVAVAGWVPWFYLGKLLWPHPLAFVYPRWSTQELSLVDFVPHALLLVIAVASFLRWKRGGRHLVLGLGSFWVGLLPVSGLVDFFYMRYAYVGDHFQYLPSLGVIALLAAGATWLVDRLAGEARRAITVVVSVVLGLVLGLLTRSQSTLYTDLESLLRGTLARNERAWMPHANLGVLLAERGDEAEALEHHRRALELYADAYESLIALGNHATSLARESGDLSHLEEAKRRYARAQAVRPEDALTAKNLGTMWLVAGDEARAIEAWDEGLALEPDNANLTLHLARLLAGAQDHALRDGPRAVELIERLLADPGNRNPTTLWVLTGALTTAGRREDARRAARETLEAARSVGDEELVRRATTVLERL